MLFMIEWDVSQWLVTMWMAVMHAEQALRARFEWLYAVFQKNGHPFYFFHNSLKWWSIYTKFLPDVAEEMLIQNIWTKYGC